MRDLIGWAALILAVGVALYLDNISSSPPPEPPPPVRTCYTLCTEMAKESSRGRKVTPACWVGYCEESCTCAMRGMDYYPCTDGSVLEGVCPPLQDLQVPVTGAFFRKAVRPLQGGD